MSEKPTVHWIGASGKSYSYIVWPLPANFNPNQNGNYIYTKFVNNQWIPIYIGQGDLKDRTENHHKAACIRNKGATHIHVHLNALEANRLAEERDLLAKYTNAYEPSGCNEKTGG
ncbi:MAG: hypothetical protein ABIJ39_09445 [Chloroflexota bacterium]